MIEAILIIICILVLAPFLTFTIVKWGVSGYYSAQRMWEKPHEDDNNEVKE